MNHDQSEIQQLVERLYEASSVRHFHLCPRQVLGVRMGMLAARYFQLEFPRQDKRILTIVETDGCFADGVTVSTGCEIGKRTLRLVDYGKVAATFIDTASGNAVRIVPHPYSRDHAQSFPSESSSRWQRYLDAYRGMPDDLLFTVTPVSLTFSIRQLISEAGRQAECAQCGEEIINGREVIREEQALCRACAGGAYYTTSMHPSRLSGQSCYDLIDRIETT
ncbi:MAG TPA: FmdE family protein [Phototrophicaceae bacterium]|jgi:formylmethanofuran dehydrogenase subunit E|nr:FmdE family protein [Phototrophicaceae bacterium]